MSGASNAQSASSDGTTAGGSSSDGTTSDGTTSDGTTTAGGTATSGSSNTTGGWFRPHYDTLREAAAAVRPPDRQRLWIANALNGGDARYSDTLAREFDYVTPENATKWGPLAPSSTSYDWQDADAILGFAEDNQQFVKGHTFVWHLQTPQLGVEQHERERPPCRVEESHRNDARALPGAHPSLGRA
jgi:GH35 family endo-1,4-beta-xylanase